LTVGSEFQFEARYFNVIGEPTNEVVFFWESSDQNLLEITAQGKATPKKEGIVLITVSVNSEVGATAPLFGKIVFKGTSYSGGFFINY